MKRVGHLPVHVGYAAILLLLINAGCIPDGTREAPVRQPQVVAPPPVSAAPSGPDEATSTSRAASQTATLDVNALRVRLNESRVIGAFTKLSLENKVDDLLERFRDHYAGKATLTMTELRRSYDLLLMKVLSLLQDTDRTLASAIVSSREAIWGTLADRKTFAALEAALGRS